MEQLLLSKASPNARHGPWHNFTSWTSHHFKHPVNVTGYALSLEDLVWAGPRMVKRLGILFLAGSSQELNSPEATPSLTLTEGLLGPGQMDSDRGIGSTTPPLSSSTVTSNPPGLTDGARGLGSVFSYATSKWALCCIAMAIILNRAYIFAATRRRLILPWHIRILIRGAPVILLVLQNRRVLQSIQCQTSPHFSAMRWGNSSMHSDLMFSGTNAFLHGLSSSLLLNPSDRESCSHVFMIPSPATVSEPHTLKGSLSLLWPLFGTFCLSQLLETIICAVEGRPLSAETGMTLFEHSLAFAEADAAISNQLGWGGHLYPVANQALESTLNISRSMILQRVNTSPEVLLVAFISSMAHITSHLLGMFNAQGRFRLLSTTTWGLCFMSSILWGAATFSADSINSQSLLRFPTVCVIGFVPHVLVLAGVAVCLSIYGFALLLSAISPPPETQGPSTFPRRLAQAQANLQANLSLADLRISRDMDFYTALLRTGFGAITLASEAVYLNEDSTVNTPRYTWLEEERFQELEAVYNQSRGSSGMAAIGSSSTRFSHVKTFRSGYSHEKTAQPSSKHRRFDRPTALGVGAAARSGRWIFIIDFAVNIYRVLLKAWALVILKVLHKVGVGSQPSWLVRLVRGGKVTRHGPDMQPNREFTTGPPSTIDGVWIPRGDQVDVEAEFRKRMLATLSDSNSLHEGDLDSRLYKWWLTGGIWGSVDGSGDYLPEEQSDISDSSSTASLSLLNSEDNEDGEAGYLAGPASFATREASVGIDMPLQLSDLSRLLQPKTLDDQEEADTLAAHLTSDGVLTRSHYERLRRLQSSRILGKGFTDIAAIFESSQRATLTADQESRFLERIILSRRQSPRSDLSVHDAQARPASASGTGGEGPPCVVCQSSPRSIIIWPCRCLSLCDDCRVSLAMNNFDKCVCCRRDVSGFSRIFVP